MWLMLEIAQRAAILAGLVGVVLTAMSVIWLLFADHDLWLRLRMWWRIRRATKATKRALAIRKEWNPRSTAMRGQF